MLKSLDNLKLLKPIDKHKFIGRDFFDRNLKVNVHVLSFDYFINESTGGSLLRYFCSNGKYYTVSQLKQRFV